MGRTQSHQGKEQGERKSPRKFFADELVRKREAAGLTQQAVADALLTSPQNVAHWEAGRRKPQLDDAKRLDELYGTDGILARMREELDEDKFADHFEQAAELEKLALGIRVYGATLVPDLLQTSDYARAVFRAGTPNYTAAAVERRIDNRIERSTLLDDADAPEMWALLDESVVLRRIGGGAVMAEQLRHIAELGRSGRVRTHILPFSHGAHALLESMVVLMRFSDAPPVAYVEGLRTGQLHDDPAVVLACQASYDLALADALPVEASLSLLEKAAEEYAHDRYARPWQG
ncbi:transcriptional regulator [Streptomyces spiroverticillatus]